ASPSFLLSFPTRRSSDLLYFAVFAFKDGINTKLLMWAPAVIVLAGLVLMGVPAFISWLRYTYRVEDMELRIEYGLRNHEIKAGTDRKSTRLNSSHVKISY